MTPVEALLRRRIAQSGPMDVAEFMELCLAHPEHGYYRTRDPLGAAGDFTTAPEISQMFGELAGLALAQAWVDQGRHRGAIVAELGPGRGTLMADALRAMRAAGMEAPVWLVETSPALRAEQARRIPGAQWADRLEEVPAAPLFLLANEFFDALPITQAVRANGVWRRRVVGLAEDKLTFGLGPLAAGPEGAPEGGVFERCAAGEAIAEALGARIAAEGGAALIIDYGYAKAAPHWGETLQALRAHRPVSPLETPGEADLTAHVDFGAIARTARKGGAAATGLTDQGVWLARLGIGQRAEALARARPDQSKEVATALHRLTDASQMGTVFKALGLHPVGAQPPPGFDAS